MPKTRKNFMKVMNQTERENLYTFLTQALYAKASFFERVCSRLGGGQIEARARRLAGRSYEGDDSVVSELQEILNSPKVSKSQRKAIEKAISRLNRLANTSSSGECDLSFVDGDSDLYEAIKILYCRGKDQTLKKIGNFTAKIVSGNYYIRKPSKSRPYNELLDCLNDVYQYGRDIDPSSLPSGDFFPTEIEKTVCRRSLFKKYCTTMSFYGKFDSNCFFRRPYNVTLSNLASGFTDCVEDWVADQSIVNVLLMLIGGFFVSGILCCIRQISRDSQRSASVQQEENRQPLINSAA